MKTVLVTGSAGFIAKNLCAQLEREDDLTILRFNRESTLKDLEEYLAQADFVFHLAGVNRPDDEKEFDTGNRGLTETILSLIQKSGKATPVLVSSSIQADRDNPYGTSKKAAEEAVFAWAKATSNQAYVYRLPNVFGKWCKPNYNSVVATFCYNIANGLDITMNDPAAQITLAYIDDVVREFLKSMRGEKTPDKDGFCDIPQTFTVTLQELADKLYTFRDIRKTSVVPNLEVNFDRFLYATYTSYLATDAFGYDLIWRRDDRGWLAEFIKSQQSGGIFISRTKPGISRGNHWHHTKIEKFLVIDGQADIKFRNLGTKEVITYQVSGDSLRVLDIPAGYVHSITNTGSTDLLTLFWSDEILDPNNPDTYFLEV